EQLRQQQIAFEKEQAERVHLQSFIDRFKAKASKAKQAQSRIKRLEKLAGTEAVRMEREFRITFAPPTKQPHSLITLRQVNCGYSVLSPSTPSDPPPVDIHAAAPSQPAVILHRVDFGLEAGDRIGLLGPNGAGKSTLVKTLVSDLAPLTGERIAHPDVRIGYFAQHTVESLHEGQSPIDHFRTLAPQAPIQSIRDFLGKWNFPGDRAFEPVDGFSGGERARLALSLIAWRQPNVLLLDEPTNHLDLEMREALAEALSDFDGAIVMVSHDRHLIGLVCDTFWRVADGVVEPFAGDLDQYAAWLRTRPAARGVRAKTEEVNQPQASLTAKSPTSQLPVKKSVNSQKLLVAEKHVSELETLLTELDRKLADPVNYANGEVMRRLGDEREHAARRLAEAEQAWFLLMDGG
ncbi:ABC transporter ATP-binding protein, partial [Xylella fastidiosa]